MNFAKKIMWFLVAALGAGALRLIALVRGEQINAVWLIVAAGCTYALATGFRVRSKAVESTLLISGTLFTCCVTQGRIAGRKVARSISPSSAKN